MAGSVLLAVQRGDLRETIIIQMMVINMGEVGEEKFNQEDVHCTDWGMASAGGQGGEDMFLACAVE